MGMAAILIYGPWLFVQIFNPTLTQSSTWSLKKFGPGGVLSMLFKDVSGDRQTYGQTDGQRTGRDHNSSAWAFGSGELKTKLRFPVGSRVIYSRYQFTFNSIRLIFNLFKHFINKIS